MPASTEPETLIRKMRGRQYLKNCQGGIVIDSLASSIRKMVKGTSIQHWKITESVYRAYVKRISRNLPGTANYVTVDFRGHSIDIERGDITILPTLITGQYESDELDAFEASISSCKVVIDVGANVGIFSVIGARKMGATGRVIAVEPNVHTRELLVSNISKLDEASASVIVVSDAIANYVGEAAWESTEYQGTGHLSGRSEGTSASMTVSVTTLDVLTSVLSIGGVDTFVKIDVEGFEPQVIEGGEFFIRQHAPRMLVEISGMNSSNVGSDWNLAAEILADTYQRGQYFGPLSEELRGTAPKEAIFRMVNDGRLHNALLS